MYIHESQREIALLWRHNEHDRVSNHQPHDCLLKRLFRRRSKKTSKPRVTGLCVGNSRGTGEFPAQLGNSRGTGEFPAQMVSNAENVSIWWRHHGETIPKSRIMCRLKNNWWGCISWWRHFMETFSGLLALCCGNSPVFGVFFDLRLNKPLSKLSLGWWFETPSRPLQSHCNVLVVYIFGLTTTAWWCYYKNTDHTKHINSCWLMYLSTIWTHIETKTKWPPFHRRHFETHFLEWKC